MLGTPLHQCTALIIRKGVGLWAKLSHGNQKEPHYDDDKGAPSAKISTSSGFPFFYGLRPWSGVSESQDARGAFQGIKLVKKGCLIVRMVKPQL